MKLTETQYEEIREQYKNLTIDELYRVMAETLIVKELYREIINLMCRIPFDQEDLMFAVPITKDGKSQLVSLHSHLTSLMAEAEISIDD